ncbi:MAG: hypothetical protein Q9182_005054 [Xanthomendoza sp. 2 TL-2023]
MAPRASSNRPASVLQGPAKGRFPTDTEPIAKNVAGATSKSTSRLTSSVTTVPDSQPLMTPTPQSTTTASGNSYDTKAILDGQRADIDRVMASVEGQRADIDRIMANVDTLMQDMKSAKASMDYLKFQQKTFAEHETVPSPTALAEDIHILTRETKVLSDGVTHIREKAGQIDRFTRELESLKERIQHLEDATVAGERKANRSVEAAVSASRRDERQQSKSHAHPEPIQVSNTVREDPSPTLLGALSAQASASRRTSTYNLPSDIVNGHVPESQISGDEDTALEDEPFESVEPRITSAEKVAAQNRRRLSDSSSDARPPLKKRGRPPKNDVAPDWTAKPMSLNDHNIVLTSDPEDDDYDPEKGMQDLGEVLANHRPSKTPVRMPTPEWEKSDWEGPSSVPPATSTRGKLTARRGVSGRGALIDRDTLRRRSSGYGNGDYVYNDSAEYWEDQNPSGPQDAADPYEKPRDSQGRLIRQNGKVDGRSLRHRRAREEKERQAAVQRQLQQTATLQASSDVAQTQQQQNVPAPGPPARSSGQNFVDAAALQAAGYTPIAPGPSTPAAGGLSSQSPFAGNGVKELDAIPANGVTSGPWATAGAVASGRKSDRHAGLMKQVFPWR